VAAGLAVAALGVALWKLGDAKRAAADRANELSDSLTDLALSYDEAAAAGIASNDVTTEAADAMAAVGFTVDDMVSIAETGTDAFQSLGDSLGGMAARTRTGLNEVGAAAVQLQELAEATRETEPAVSALAAEMANWVLTGELTVEQAREIANAVDENADAFDQALDGMQKNAEALARVAGGQALFAQEAAKTEAILAAQTDGFDVAALAADETAESMLEVAAANIAAATSVEGVRAILAALSDGLVLTETEALNYVRAVELAEATTDSWENVTGVLVAGLVAVANEAAGTEGAVEALEQAEATAAAQAEILAAQHEGLVQAMQEATSALEKSIDDFVSLESAYDSAAAAADEANRSVTMQDWINEQNRLIEETRAWASNLESLHGRVGDDLIQEIASWGPEAADKVALLAGATDDELAEFEANFKEAGALSNQLLNGELALIRDAMVRTMASAILEASIIGQNIAAALASGIDAEGYRAIQASGRLATSIIEANIMEFDISSPSKVFIRIGENVAEGLAVGIGNGTGTAVASAEELSALVIGAMGDGFEEAMGRAKEAIAAADLENEFQSIIDGVEEAAQAVADAWNELVSANLDVIQAQRERDEAYRESVKVTNDDRPAIMDATDAHRDAVQAIADLDTEIARLTWGQRDLNDLTYESARAHHDAVGGILAAKDAISDLTWEIDQLNNGTREMNDLTLDSALGQANAALNLFNAQQKVKDLTKEYDELTKAGKDTTEVGLKLDVALLREEEALRKVAEAAHNAQTVSEELADKTFELEGALLDSEAATTAYTDALEAGKTVEEAMTLAIEARDRALIEEEEAQRALEQAVIDSTGPTDELREKEEALAEANEAAALAEEEHRTKMLELNEAQVAAQEEMVRLILQMAEVQLSNSTTGGSFTDLAETVDGETTSMEEDVEAAARKMKQKHAEGMAAMSLTAETEWGSMLTTTSAKTDSISSTLSTATQTWNNTANAKLAEMKGTFQTNFDGMVGLVQGAVGEINTSIQGIRDKTVTITTRTVNEVATRDDRDVGGGNGAGAGDAGTLNPNGITPPSKRGNRAGRDANDGFGGTTDSEGNSVMMPTGGIMPARGPIMRDGKHRLAGVMPGELVLNEASQKRLFGDGRPGGVNVTINVAGDLDQKAADKIVDKLRDYDRRNGGVPITATGR
jgi:hypothetical protein